MRRRMLSVCKHWSMWSSLNVLGSAHSVLTWNKHTHRDTRTHMHTPCGAVQCFPCCCSNIWCVCVCVSVNVCVYKSVLIWMVDKLVFDLMTQNSEWCCCVILPVSFFQRLRIGMCVRERKTRKIAVSISGYITSLCSYYSRRSGCLAENMFLAVLLCLGREALQHDPKPQTLWKKRTIQCTILPCKTAETINDGYSWPAGTTAGS